MKIRTITTGFSLKLPLKEERFRKIADFTIRAKKEFEKRGYVVQTTRTSTQPWEEYFQSKKLNKPLSARLMPVPDKKIGEMTKYKFEYFANSKTMEI